MRQRKINNFEERLEAVKKTEYFLEEIAKNKGKWVEKFKGDAPIFLELGCGKGNFINKKARDNQKNNYIAIEGEKSAVVVATEKAIAQGHKNLVLAGEFVKNIEDIFGKGELAGIYLNFSDPWPKKRNAKRRLTYRNYLLGYREVLAKGGFVEFKTDNDDLFDFTLEEIKNIGGNIIEMSRDLHSSEFQSRLTMTEYEEKFKNASKNINYIKFKP